MVKFSVHTIESAPAGSRETLTTVRQNLGGIPNLAATMAESPSLVKGFFGLRAIYLGGTFSEADIQVLSLANAMANRCEWCVSFHSAFAIKAGVPLEAVEALREGRLPAESRFRALSKFTQAMIQARGRVSDKETEEFLSAGFTKAQVLEVIVGIAFSTMANYAEHIGRPPLDSMLESQKFLAVY